MRTPLIWFVAILTMLLCDAHASAQQYTVRQMVEGAVARRDAIVSGTIEYVRTSGFVTNAGRRREVHHSYSRSGENWARRWPDSSANTKINVDGRMLEFTPLLPIHSLKRPLLKIGNPRSLEKVETYPGVYFLGTLCFSSTADFIRQHADECILGGKHVVNGVETTLLSWNVREDEKFAAFNSVAPPVLKGGVLQLYVAPQLAFALPRVAYLAPDGFVASSFDSFEFKEDAAGIFFPRRSRMQHNQPRPGYYEEYDIKLVEDINQPVPREKFTIDIPKGTRVVYSRGRKDAIDFTLGEQVNSEDLEKVLSVELGPRGSRARKTARRK